MRRSLVVALAAGVLLAGCTDPQQAAAALFLKNGLHLLLPLRSYITLGGLVVVPAKGSPYYVDPLDPIPAAMQPDILDFKSVLAQQSGSRATGLTAAVSALQQLVKAPASFKLSATQRVTLAQVEASGVRMKIPAVQSFIGLKGTTDWINQELGQKSKTFIIYEVYKGKDLTLEAQGSQSIDVGLAIGASTKAGSVPGSTATPATPAAPIQPTTSSGTTIAPEPACAASATPSPATPPSATAGATASGYWVRTSKLRLALCGTDEYPFRHSRRPGSEEQERWARTAAW